MDDRCATPLRARAIANALPGALARAEMTLAYQPQVCLSSGRVIGAEALLRWNCASLGEVSPGEFVPAAEAEGQITALGRWALQTACKQAAAWRAAGLPEVRIGVNVSPHQFRSDDMTAVVRRALADSGLPPQALGIEITESALLHDAHSVAMALRPLQADGVEIALDDFGTGYSSLSRLRELPIDVIKIDRSFVHDVTAAAASASVTRSVIHLAHGLHLHVLAEGVETDEQLRLLVRHGCDRIQGWVFGKAMSADEFARLLAGGAGLPSEFTHGHEHRRTLLLVDDEAHILSALKRLLRRDGYHILTAGSGAEALELLRGHAVDVIISDQRMPGMTGVDFLRRAKEQHPQTIRMTLSGYTDLQSIIDAVNEGAVYKFLTKPWDDERLREHVALAFRQCELADENQRLTRQISTANTDLAQANRRLEQMVRKEQDQADAMSSAAGAARDLVDLMPLAVFGVDPDGTLVYVNHRARQEFPAWAAELGGEADPVLRRTLHSIAMHGAHAVRVNIDGAPFDAWSGRLPDCAAGAAQVLMLQVVRGAHAGCAGAPA